MRKLLTNQSGVALMMIMTSIILLMAIYGQFTFDSKISRIKATNIMDRSQARLLAESGFQLALTRLKLYKEAFNKIQGNPTAKEAVPVQLLNQLWEVPFIYPIPITDKASASFKDTVNKFQTESLLEGEMKVSIQNISSRINLNLLRMDMSKFDPNTFQQEASSFLDQSDAAINTNVNVAQALYFSLKKLVEQKKDKDESFDDRNGNLNYQDMLTNLKYFVSDYQSLQQDPLAGEAENTFNKIPMTPKFGPMGSASELYSIPGWNDELVELMQNEFSVYPGAKIDLNKLTANMFRIIIPTATEDDIKEFFVYRDDPTRPKYFNSTEDFKKYVVDVAHLMSPENFDERMKLFEAKGISFGSSPNLFRIVSEGTYNRSVFTLVAIVVLPTQGQAQANTSPTTTTQPGTPPGSTPPTSGATTATTAAAQNTQLMEPRVIEILVN